MRITAEIDDPTQTLVGYHGRLSMREQETTIWMDGRSVRPTTPSIRWSGFSTGEWDGDVLVADRDAPQGELHSALGADAQRPGDGAHPLQAHRNNYLRATVIIYDPVYIARALHPHVADLGARSEPRAAAVSVRRGDRDRRRARHGASLPARKEPAAGAESGTRTISSGHRTRRASADPRRCIRSTSRRCSRSRGRT